MEVGQINGNGVVKAVLIIVIAGWIGWVSVGGEDSFRHRLVRQARRSGAVRGSARVGQERQRRHGKERSVW